MLAIQFLLDHQHMTVLVQDELFEASASAAQLPSLQNFCLVCSELMCNHLEV
jgi:hypothetical protein